MPTEHKPIVLIDGELTQLPDDGYIARLEEDLPQLEEVDFVDDDLIYRGWAEIGSLTTDPVWKIARMTFTGADEDMRKDWADGGQYTTAWIDRADIATIYT